MDRFEYNLDDYEYVIVDNCLIINRREVQVSREELLNTSLAYSTILEVNSGNESYPSSYKGILDKILVKFTARRLKDISIFRNRIKDGECLTDGYHYLENINISYCGLCADDCKRELLNLLNHLNIDFYMRIRLNNGNIIRFANSLI